MKIDLNEKELAALHSYERGDRKEAVRLENEFVEELQAAMERGEDHCSCTVPCRWHGKCAQCVAIHRAHGDHLPACFHSMLNERLRGLSALSEHTLFAQRGGAEPSGTQ